MDAATKTTFKAKLNALSQANQGFKATMGMQVPPVIGGMPPAPIVVGYAFMDHFGAIRNHAEDFDKLIALLNEIIDKI